MRKAKCPCCGEVTKIGVKVVLWGEKEFRCTVCNKNIRVDDVERKGWAFVASLPILCLLSDDMYFHFKGILAWSIVRIVLCMVLVMPAQIYLPKYKLKKGIEW